MNPLRTTAALLLSVVLATVAVAHDTWLIPGRFSVTPNAFVFLDLTSGMAFPKLETQIKAERIDRAQCRLAGQTAALSDLFPAPNSLRFRAIFRVRGTATCWVELKPKAIKLTPKQVDEYLDEISVPGAIRQQWATSPEPRRWRELYTKHAKTFISVGVSERDGSWAEPVGMALEIVLENDPSRLRKGDELLLRVFENGAPLSDFPLEAVREGGGHGVVRKTDRQGRVSFRPLLSGRWLLHGTKLRKSTQPDVDWESDFTTLTLNLR